MDNIKKTDSEERDRSTELLTAFRLSLAGKQVGVNINLSDEWPLRAVLYLSLNPAHFTSSATVSKTQGQIASANLLPLCGKRGREMEHETGCKSMQEKDVGHSTLGYLGQAPICSSSKEPHFVRLRLKISFEPQKPFSPSLLQCVKLCW